MAKEMVAGIMRDLNEEMRVYNAKWAVITGCAKQIRPARIAHFIARHELEPDEVQTAERKAERMITLGYSF
jgi:hypothetical protein